MGGQWASRVAFIEEVRSAQKLKVKVGHQGEYIGGACPRQSEQLVQSIEIQMCSACVRNCRGQSGWNGMNVGEVGKGEIRKEMGPGL